MRRQSKYRAVPTTVNGITFASKAEARRYRELLLLGDAGEVRNLELQPRFALSVSGERVCEYVADFRYEQRVIRCGLRTATVTDVWLPIVEDVKGIRTPVYRLKKKLMKACYGIDVQEVR